MLLANGKRLLIAHLENLLRRLLHEVSDESGHVLKLGIRRFNIGPAFERVAETRGLDDPAERPASSRKPGLCRFALRSPLLGPIARPHLLSRRASCSDSG